MHTSKVEAAIYAAKNELSKVKAVTIPGYEQSYPDLKAFIDAYLNYTDGHKVLLYGGAIGSGKTRFRHLSNRYRGLTYAVRGEILPIAIRTWEHCENLGREGGWVQTSKGCPLQPDELEAVSVMLETGLEEAIKSNADTEIEAPILTSINMEQVYGYRKFMGRELGLKALYFLTHYFGEHFLKLPSHEVWAVGLSAGPHLRYVAPVFKEGIKRVDSLDEGIALAHLCGLEPPRNKDDLINMKKDGATMIEIMSVRRQFEEEIMPLYRMVGEGRFLHNDPVITEGEMLWHIYTDVYNLALPVNRVFIGVNEIPGFYDRRFARLLDEFVNSRGSMRLSTDWIDSILDHVAKAADRVD